jgi:septum formation protein
MTDAIQAHGAGTKRRLILASASPRRRQLLAEAGFEFEIHPADIDEEQYPPGLTPSQLAQWLAAQKAAVVAEEFADAVVLAADTVVALGEQLLGKPRDSQHARQMLQTLSGTTHQVTTGIAVVCKADQFTREDCVLSSVQMRKMSAAEIDDYVATGLWEGKAGGYGIQDKDPFVTRISGDLTNIVGLPMERTVRLLKEAGVDPGNAG